MIQTSLLIFDPFKNKNFHHVSTNPLYLFYKGDVHRSRTMSSSSTTPTTTILRILTRWVDSLNTLQLFKYVSGQHTLGWRLISQ